LPAFTLYVYVAAAPLASGYDFVTGLGSPLGKQPGPRLERHELRNNHWINVYKSGDFLDIDLEIVSSFLSSFYQFRG
jgi:hypothetical protein